MNERLLRALIRLSTSRPRIVLLTWLVLLIAATPAVVNVSISTSTDSVLDRSDPAWAFYQASVDRFGGDEVLVVALESERPFDTDLLRKLNVLSRRLGQIAGVRRVDSLSTVPLVRVDDHGVLDLSAALESGVPKSAEEVSRLRALIKADRIAPRALISKDERVVALNVQLEGEPEGGIDRVVAEVAAVLDGTGAWVSGVPVFRAEINRTAGIEIAKFVVMTVIVVGVVMFLIIRSFSAVLVALGVGGAGTWITMAGLGVTSTPLTLITVILPSLMLALGCAYSMHLIAAARGASTREELRTSLAPVLEPTALSGLTTTIGFLAVAAVRIDAVRQVGTFGALGAFSVVAVALTAVPAALALWPLSVDAPPFERWLRSRLSEVCIDFVRRRSGSTVIAWALLTTVLGLGLTQVVVETDVTRWFPRGSHVRDSYERIRESLSGISPMNVVVRATGSPVTAPETLVALDGLTSFLDSLPEVGKAISIADPIRQLHAGFAGPSAGGLPTSAALIDQYLLLLSSIDYLEDLLAFDRSSANVIMRVDHNGSEHLLDVAAQAEEWWRANGPPGTEARTTGIMYEFARAQDEIAFGQVRGLSFALAVILILMIAIYRSPRIAAIAMIPNVLPLVLVFGFLGLAAVPMDAGIIVSGCLILGIAVDDTLHLVSSYRDGCQRGEDGLTSLSGALRHVLTPVFLTTVVIGLGFSVLAFSSFAFVRNLGILVVCVMVICFLADLLLLPSLLIRFGRTR